MNRQIDIICANCLRALSADGIQKANSGHPGLPLGTADYAYTLWSKHLIHNVKDTQWINRDRFVLSAGHGSMLLYSLLHLTGYNLSIEDLKQFRQWGSKTPGHPEYGHTDGVETTTGPLGQGLANAVGMAIASKMMKERLNNFGKKIIDNKIYVIAGDGCMMEGITSEAASYAGHLGLDNLIVFYDDNNITIEGRTDITFTEDVAKRYEAYNWEVITANGHDFDEIDNAINSAKNVKGKPTIVIFKTIIGQGSPNKKNSPGVHGSPLGPDEIKLMKEQLGCNPNEHFCIPEQVKNIFENRKTELTKVYESWKSDFDELYNSNEEFKKVYDNLFNAKLNSDAREEMYKLFPTDKKIATRAAGGKVLNYLADVYEPLVGGSADLAPSTKTYLDNYKSIQKNDFQGKNLNFGVREHSMAAIMNGMTLYKPFITYGSTFHVFTDYCRPSVRLSALMSIKVVYVMTHDSIFVGEDGPTHEPIEQTMACRLIPNLSVIRPADAIETADAWATIIEGKDRPAMILLSRQNLPVYDRLKYNKSEVSKGGYILKSEKDKDKLDGIIIATGSEVEIAVQAAEKLENEGKSIRVVSMPCFEYFDEQTDEYKNTILPLSCKNRIGVEAGVTTGWEKYVFDSKNVVGIDHYGASAPAEILAEKFGFTSENIVKKMNLLLT